MELSVLDRPDGPDLSREVVSDLREHRMLRPRDVCARTTLSSSHTYRLQAQARFPAYVVLGDRVRGLPEHVLDAFLAERLASRSSMLPLGFRPPLPLWHFDPSKVPARCGISLLCRRRVAALTGLAKSTFYPLIRRGRFPAPVSLGPWAARWVAHEVEAWVLASAPASSVSRPVGRPGALPALSP